MNDEGMVWYGMVWREVQYMQLDGLRLHRFVIADVNSYKLLMRCCADVEREDAYNGRAFHSRPGASGSDSSHRTGDFLERGRGSGKRGVYHQGEAARNVYARTHQFGREFTWKQKLKGWSGPARRVSWSDSGSGSPSP